MNLQGSKKSPGFTLVELLIVMLIIGVLAGMMMQVSQSAIDKAEATKIVSNLRVIKAAAPLRYAEVGSWDKVLADDSYFSGGLSETEAAAYSVRQTIQSGSNKYYYVRCVIKVLYSDASKQKRIEDSLIAMAKNGVPLYKGSFASATYQSQDIYVNLRITN